MHYHWAKLYLQSYALRGLPDIHNAIPSHFLENASAAVQAAIAIITLLLEDKDAQHAIGYVPHHIHGMIAFACMFLLKVATKHSEQLFVDVDRFRNLVSALAHQIQNTDVGRDHLIHRMAEGLEKMAQSLGGKTRKGGSVKKNGVQQIASDGSMKYDPVNNARLAVTDHNNSSNITHSHSSNHLSGYGDQALDPNGFDFSDPALGLGMPFFDFEGTSLSGTDAMWNFSV